MFWQIDAKGFTTYESDIERETKAHTIILKEQKIERNKKSE
jgi:hypothetical protein